MISNVIKQAAFTGLAASLATLFMSGFAMAEKIDHSGHDMGNMKMMDMGDIDPSMKNRNLVIGRMKITLMPEYDSQSVLVVQEGRFADRTAFPNEVTFALPGSVTKLTDVCSLSPGGRHFCQLFDIKEGADSSKYLDIKLPFSDFFIDYQYAPFKVMANSDRTFSFTVNSKYNVKNLEVHVQKPFRSERFKVSPAVMDSYSKDGFEYAKYSFRDFKAGDLKKISISYFKPDTHPSVDIKFSIMSTPSMFSGYSGEMALAFGAAALGGLWFLRRKSARKEGDAV